MDGKAYFGILLHVVIERSQTNSRGKSYLGRYFLHAVNAGDKACRKHSELRSRRPSKGGKGNELRVRAELRRSTKSRRSASNQDAKNDAVEGENVGIFSLLELSKVSILT